MGDGGIFEPEALLGGGAILDKGWSMIYPISTKTCTEAWLKAANLLLSLRGYSAHNLILDIEDPITLGPSDKRIVSAMDAFLAAHGADPLATVAGTIFPASYYRQRGAKGVLEDFPNKIYPKIRKNWGTYAGRMLRRDGKNGMPIKPLEILINKLRTQTKLRGPLRNIYELGFIDISEDLPIYDPRVDARRTLNQPCLSHLSFKLIGRNELALTALYRSHYYMQRTLGNLLGLSQLLFFVAAETGLRPKGLICHSTFARLDTDAGWRVSEIKSIIGNCNQLWKEQAVS